MGSKGPKYGVMVWKDRQLIKISALCKALRHGPAATHSISGPLHKETPKGPNDLPLFQLVAGSSDAQNSASDRRQK